MSEGIYIISRQEAIAEGLGRYFTGIPCKHGHVCERITISCDCLLCHRLISRNKGRREINIKRAKERFFKRTYGLTPSEFSDMLWDQNYKCLCCGDKFNEKTPHLDHCHKTEKIRGILCHKCNTGLGLFNDDIEILQKAIDYLRKFNDLEKSSKTTTNSTENWKGDFPGKFSSKWV